MKDHKMILLSALLATTVVLAAISFLAFAYAGTSSIPVYQNSTTSYPGGMMGGRGGMGGMWGGNWGQTYDSQNTGAAQNTFLPTIGIAALVGAVITGAGGTAYYFKPSKTKITKQEPQPTLNDSPQNTVTPYDSIAKTLTNEERKVLDILVSHDGKYLQKYIRLEAGMSRLKTHRIVNRLAERGIVTLEKSGNSNQVLLSSWLHNPSIDPTNKEKPAEIEAVA